MKPTILLLALVPCIQAAVITGSGGPATNTTATSDYLFQSGTDTDWGYFSPGSTATADFGTINATNTSSTGPRTFTVSAVTSAVSGLSTRVRGSGSTAANTFFSFGDGTSPTIGSDLQFNGVFNAALGSAGVNNGVQMTLSGFTGPTTILLWVYNFQAEALLTALVNGAPSSFTPVTIDDATGGKVTSLYSFTFTPDSTSDSVNFRYVMSASHDSNANAGFVAVAIVPEPSSLALAALAGAAFGFRRRR